MLNNTYMEYETDQDGDKCIVLRGTILTLRSRGVGFGKNMMIDFSPRLEETVNGTLPRYETGVVVMDIHPDAEFYGGYFGFSGTFEFWNHQIDTAVEQYGTFAVGDHVKILQTPWGIPSRIEKL